MIDEASAPSAPFLALGDLEPAADLLKCLGHPHRLTIVCALMSGERAVSELERECAIRQPSLSQHLASLRDAGAITARRRAKSVIYKITDDRIVRIVEVLRSVFDTTSLTGACVGGKALSPRPLRDGGSPNENRPRPPAEAAFFAKVGPRELT
jgi:DNA-binding transcriptional ArsR family regulator